MGMVLDANQRELVYKMDMGLFIVEKHVSKKKLHIYI